MKIIEKIKQKGASKEKIAKDASENPECIPDLLQVIIRPLEFSFNTQISFPPNERQAQESRISRE